MCGGHGIYHLIALVGHDADRQAGEGLRPHAGAAQAGTAQQVKLMYARGEIGAEAFRRLLDMAQAGQLSRDDLRAFAAGAAPSPRSNQQPTGEPSPSVPRPLQERRQQLEAACAETEASIRRLRLEAARLAQDDETGSLAHSLDERIAQIARQLSHLKTERDEAAAHERLLAGGAVP